MATRTIVPAPDPYKRQEYLKHIKWWLFDIFGYDPHSGQLPFHLSGARYRSLIAGTRGGKSRAAGEEGCAYLFTGAVRIWIVGQTYALTEKEFRYIYERMTSYEVAKLFGGRSPLEHSTYNVKGGDMYLRTTWGAEVQCISLEKANIGAFGEEVDLIILSEAAQIRNPREVYERVLHGRLANRLGDVIIPTTPAGKSNEHDKDGWLFDMFLKGLDEGQENYFTVVFPSWANPEFKEDPYELRGWMDEKVFSEQYEAQFMVFSGAVFDRFSDRVHVIKPFEPPAHWSRYEAIDPGFAGKFVWLSSVLSPENNLYIIDEYSDSETDYETRAKEIKRLRALEYNIHPDLWDIYINKHNVKTITYVDSEDPQAIAELTKYGIPGYGANKKEILVTVDRVNRRLKWSSTHAPSLYITSNCVDTIDAFRFHSWGEKPATGYRKPANDQWKHWMDCVRYICSGTLIPPERKETFLESWKQIGEPTLWEIMMETIDHNTGLLSHPHDWTAEQRRARI